MNPIAIAALIGGAGYAIYKFISRPTIDVETAPNTPGEKAMKELDETLEMGYELLAGIGKGINTYFDEQFWGKRKLSYHAALINVIFNSKNRSENFIDYYNKLGKGYTNAWGIAVRNNKGTGNYNNANMARGIKNEIQSLGSRLFKLGALVDVRPKTGHKLLWPKDKILATVNFVENLPKNQVSNLKSISNPLKKFHAKQTREDFWRLLGSNINQFPVFTGLPMQKPFPTAIKGVNYYFYSMYPASRRLHVIMVALNNRRQITEFHQMRTGSLTLDAKVKLAQTAYFGKFDAIFQLFFIKFKTLGFTFEKRD